MYQYMYVYIHIYICICIYTLTHAHIDTDMPGLCKCSRWRYRLCAMMPRRMISCVLQVCVCIALSLSLSVSLFIQMYEGFYLSSYMRYLWIHMIFVCMSIRYTHGASPCVGCQHIFLFVWICIVVLC